uniref:carbamoyl-phosphate synthase arginine-specific small subunit n=1 Tax=Rhodella violacea TaxID=2801 RepID=UPI001FCCDA13|nr:carbamoyl-phosphate synthase arginine-specific small subunit [Rhodella violacea]UNJ18143.1 carbamoyl-phosphate synthase arginine-specific small subunit [Rhodella violacea]
MHLTKAILMLEDGTSYKGWSFNPPNTSSQGEVVFNTSMTGYQEICTDPSYSGQIMTFTYPEIGNTGINFEDAESKKIHIKGVILKNFSEYGYNWRQENSLANYLCENNILTIVDIDTRTLVKHLRECGAMNGYITTENISLDDLKDKVKSIPKMQGQDLIKNVTADSTYSWMNTYTENWYLNTSSTFTDKQLHIVVVDFGVKHNILNRLTNYGCKVTIVPAIVKIEEILQLAPDGILLSNGPGDPASVTYGIDLVKNLINIEPCIPIFGICMGHQILSLALGLDTFKLKFGHRGPNHPAGLKNRIEITSQNHGFAVQKSSSINNLKVTHINLNDNTLAGICLKDKPIFSVQYHPEASPGPHDSDYIFSHFLSVVSKFKDQSFKYMV